MQSLRSGKERCQKYAGAESQFRDNGRRGATSLPGFANSKATDVGGARRERGLCGRTSLLTQERRRSLPLPTFMLEFCVTRPKCAVVARFRLDLGLKASLT